MSWQRVAMHAISVAGAVALFALGGTPGLVAGGTLLGLSGGAEVQRHRSCRHCERSKTTGE